MRAHAHKKKGRVSSAGLYAYAVLAFLVVVVATGLFADKGAAFTSAEVHFADASPSGLQIVPASCASPPIAFTDTSTGDYCTPGCTDPSASNYNSAANGDDGSCTYPVGTPVCPTIADSANAGGPAFRAWAGISDRQINVNTAPICIANTSVNTYFVPANSLLEINAFKTNLPPGASYQNI